jgi:hypothetical protein
MKSVILNPEDIEFLDKQVAHLRELKTKLKIGMDELDALKKDMWDRLCANYDELEDDMDLTLADDNKSVIIRDGRGAKSFKEFLHDMLKD